MLFHQIRVNALPFHSRDARVLFTKGEFFLGCWDKHTYSWNSGTFLSIFIIHRETQRCHPPVGRTNPSLATDNSNFCYIYSTEHARLNIVDNRNNTLETSYLLEVINPENFFPSMHCLHQILQRSLVSMSIWNVCGCRGSLSPQLQCLHVSVFRSCRSAIIRDNILQPSSASIQAFAEYLWRWRCLQRADNQGVRYPWLRRRHRPSSCFPFKLSAVRVDV